MKYSMVKQFSNASVDNVFNFFFKIVDFGKIMRETFWAFLEIWVAFFLIFYNAFMYIYYLFLFFVDFSADESKGTYISLRRGKPRKTHAPAINIPNVANPVPSIYGKVSSAASSSAASVSGSIRSTVSAVKPSPVSRTAKRQWGKTILESLSSALEAITGFFSKPFTSIAQFFGTRMKPIREEDMPSDRTRLRSQGKSLIDEYMKEYEKKKR